MKISTWYLVLGFFITVVTSVEDKDENNALKLKDRDPLRLFDSASNINVEISRTKRDTTIIHRVRKRRPKYPASRKKTRRPQNRQPQRQPLYNAPNYSTSININPPTFTSSDFTGNTKGYAEAPPPTAFSAPSAPSFTSNGHHGGLHHQSHHSYGVSSHGNINSIPAPTQYSIQSAPYVPSPPAPPAQTYSSSVLGNPPPTHHTYPANSIHSSHGPPISFVPQVQASNPPRVIHSRPKQRRPEYVPPQPIPVEVAIPNDPYNSPVTSYDVPVNSYTGKTQNIQSVQSQKTISYNPPRPLSTQYEIQQGGIITPTPQAPQTHLLPSLPKYYEPDEFHSIQSQIPSRNDNNKNSYLDDDSFEAYLNDVSESQRVNVKTKPKGKQRSKNKEKERKKSESLSFEDFSEEFSLESFKNYKPSTPSTTTTTSTTTKRPKSSRPRRKKRPKVSSTTQHVLDSEDLKDAYESESEIQEIIFTPNDAIDFESKKFFKISKPTPTYVPSTKYITTKSPGNYVLLSAQNSDSLEEIQYVPRTRYKTERPKTPTYSHRPRVRIPAHSGKNDDDEIDILSIQKSKSKSYYMGSEKEKPPGSRFEFTIPNNNDDFDVFETGVFVLNNGYGTRVKHGRSKKHMADSLEDYMFEAEYEIEIPTNDRFFDKK